MVSAYTYDPLPMNGLMTRLIKLKPATQPRADLHGEIFITDLDTRKGPILKYEAISYTWGGQSPSLDHFILCSCKDNTLSRLNLTANTNAALRRVRLRHEARYIWIDAICIDQSSMEDKQRQIANMGFVYSLAQRVLVWLGDNVTRDGLLTIKYIQELAMHNPTDTDSGGKLQRVFDNIREDSKPQKSHSSGSKWSLMEGLFCHPWFTRVWTLQEIALNPSSALIYYGDETMEWEEITRAMDVMQKYLFDHYTVLYDALGTFIKMQSQVQRWRSSWSLDFSLNFLHFDPSDSNRPQLSDIFTDARNRKSSEPKDSVFGLYGICLFLDLYIPPPNYRKDLQQIFFEVTEAIIESEDSLSMLYEVGGPNRTDSLPSWVPDWKHGWAHLSTAPITLHAGFNAGGATPVFHIDNNLRTLKLRGTIIDTVSWVGGLVPFFDDVPFLTSLEPEIHLYPKTADDRWQAYQVFREWAQCVHESLIRPEAIDDFYYTILQGSPVFEIEGRTRPSKLDPEKIREHKLAFKRWYDALLETNKRVLREKTQDQKDRMNRIWCTRTLHPGGDGSDPGLGRFHHHAWSTSRGRRLFLTKDARMGTAQGDVSLGDVVAVVAGLKLPLILSPVGSQFRLVGHGYIHGIMDGEAWPKDGNGLRIITLV